MVISNRIKTLDLLIDASEDHDLRLEARREKARLMVQLALIEPTTLDLREEARIADEARAEEERVRLAAIQQRTHDRMKDRIITQEPRKS
jgi:hypothetical protein